jgi:hypothetical protein
MKSPPDADDEEPPPELLDALLEAPLPDCRQPVNVMFWLPPLLELLLPLLPDCPELEPEVLPVVDPVVEPAPDPDPDPAPDPDPLP